MSYERVLERLSAAALRTGRSPAEITLVVVTKNQPLEAIHADTMPEIPAASALGPR